MTGYILVVVQDPERLLHKIKVPPNLLVIKQTSVRKAFQMALHVIPAVVLTEHYLPDGEGLNLGLALKNHPCLQHVPIILLGMDDLLYHDQSLGITRYLPAHARPSQINQVLREVLAGQDSRQLVSA